MKSERQRGSSQKFIRVFFIPEIAVCLVYNVGMIDPDDMDNILKKFFYLTSFPMFFPLSFL
jgi:hypothetical protein